MFLLLINGVIERICNTFYLYIIVSTVINEVMPGPAAIWKKKAYLIFSIVFHYDIWINTLKNFKPRG